jgi:hypothetical protein
MSEYYKEFDKHSRKTGWRIALWIIVGVVFFSLLGWAGWGLGVLSSPIKGAGDAFKTKESGVNRIRAQEEFVQTYNDLLAADQRITVMWKAQKKNPSTINETNYIGAVNFCIQMVADYTALGRKYTSEDWRPADLPLTIDGFDSATDCKENTK